MHLLAGTTRMVRIAFVFWITALGNGFLAFVVLDHIMQAPWNTLGAIGSAYLFGLSSFEHEWMIAEREAAMSTLRDMPTTSLRASLQEAYQDFTESSATNGFLIGFLAPYSIPVYWLGPLLWSKRTRESLTGARFSCLNHWCCFSRDNLPIPAQALLMGAGGRVLCGHCRDLAAHALYRETRQDMVRAGLVGGALWPVVIIERYQMLPILAYACSGALAALVCFRRDRLSQSPFD